MGSWKAKRGNPEIMEPERGKGEGKNTEKR